MKELGERLRHTAISLVLTSMALLHGKVDSVQQTCEQMHDMMALVHSGFAAMQLQQQQQPQQQATGAPSPPLPHLRAAHPQAAQQQPVVPQPQQVYPPYDVRPVSPIPQPAQPAQARLPPAQATEPRPLSPGLRSADASSRVCAALERTILSRQKWTPPQEDAVCAPCFPRLAPSLRAQHSISVM